MRVLVSSGFRWWNAEADYAASVTRLLRDAGHAVWVATGPGTRNAAELSGLGLDPLTDLGAMLARPIRWPSAVRTLRRLIRDERIDVVNVFRSADLPAALWAVRGTPAALVRTRGGAQAERRGWLNRRLYGTWPHGTIASCELIAKRLRERLGVTSADLHTIYYPVSLPPVPTPEAREITRADLLREAGRPDKRFLLAMVGRIAPEKGVDRLVAAMELLVRERPDALLLLFNKGRPAEAPHRRALETEIERRGLEESIVWSGYRENVREAMAAVDLGVIPSVASEMNCRVGAEFLSMRTPVVAFPTGALPEVIEHGVSGWITANPDPAELATALAELAADPPRVARLGRNARDAAERRFSEERFLTETLTAFQDAITKKIGRSAKAT